MKPNSTFTLTHARWAPILLVAAPLLLAPYLLAQTPGSAKQPASQNEVKPARQPSESVLSPNHPAREKSYSLKFKGGETWDLNYALREQLSAENVVVSDSVRPVRMPAFELRNVRLSEIGRTIEFLSEGQLRVEISENAGSGHVWLIGRLNPAEAAATVKTRSVAAPHIFADEKALTDIRNAAEEMEMNRAQISSVTGGARGVFRGASLKLLKSQNLFVITGDEAGVDGVESLIKAAEQRLADVASANAAAAASNGPKMRAVLAPHLFAREHRLKNLLEVTERMRAELANLNAERLKGTGLGSASALKLALPWVKVDVHIEQNFFLVYGTEAGIAGVESLIKSAEQLAAEEDERIERKAAEVKAREEAATRKQP